MELEPIKRAGLAAAFKGAMVLRARFGRLLEIRKKDVTDLVTDADLQSEKVIIETIREQFPDHGILAEESGRQAGSNGCQWIIDPLDGTTNFAHRVGIFAISIAFFKDREALFGLVLNPLSGELFSAVRGLGATLNGQAIQVSTTGHVQDSLLATGFPYNLKPVLPGLTRRFTRCLTAARGIRRLGAAALDLCYVACGRYDGFWEERLKPWDTAAGMLIASEAGARITDFSGRPFAPAMKAILTTNGRIHAEMLALLATKETPI